MWQDTSRYSRQDKERKPTTFTATEGPLEITVTCAHVLYRPEWVMHCAAVAIDTLHLPFCGSVEEAQAQAIAIVRNRLGELAKHAEILAA